MVAGAGAHPLRCGGTVSCRLWRRGSSTFAPRSRSRSRESGRTVTSAPRSNHTAALAEWRGRNEGRRADPSPGLDPLDQRMGATHTHTHARHVTGSRDNCCPNGLLRLVCGAQLSGRATVLPGGGRYSDIAVQRVTQVHGSRGGMRVPGGENTGAPLRGTERAVKRGGRHLLGGTGAASAVR